MYYFSIISIAAYQENTNHYLFSAKLFQGIVKNYSKKKKICRLQIFLKSKIYLLTHVTIFPLL